MKTKDLRLGLRLALVISSIGLLIILQGFWLTTSYESAYISFRRESSSILRSTLFTLRDSIFQKNIIYVSDDGIAGDSLRMIIDLMKDSLENQNTISKKLNVYNRIPKGRKFITSTMRVRSAASDSANAGKGLFRDHPNMIVRMDPDSISAQIISAQYRAALNQAKLDTLFEIRHYRIPLEEFRNEKWMPGFESGDREREIKPRIFSDTLTTEGVRINPAHIYLAIFPNIRIIVVKEITPQIFFSLFLTTMMTASFAMMYRSMRKQEQLMNMKNDFISNVTHELKTPMATVSVALEALKSFDVLRNEEKTKEYIGIAQNELNRLSLMTDKILKTAVFESQGIAFVSEKIVVSNIIRMVLDSMKLVFNKKNIVVNYQDSGLGGSIEGSEMHITNVVYNLIDNAVKYSHGDSSIEITLTELPNSIEFAVADHGIGILKEYQSRIFDKFFRVPTGDVHNTKGYGLGLNYVSDVIKSHHGSIKVDSNPGQGSIFYVTLPKVHGGN
ncbi:MAG: HAMP domain-containing sensor histidine kinase [Chryseolinea sp.]